MNMQGKKWLALLLAACMAAVSIAGCAPAQPQSETAEEAPEGEAVAEVKIGHIHPLTGTLAMEGNEMRDGIIMAVNEINEAGGIQSLGGAQVTLLHGDNEFSPEKGASETERLIREGAVAILGAYASSVTFTATQIAEREKVPFVVTVAVSDDICERGFQYTFRVQPNARTMAYYHTEYLKEINEKYNGGIEDLLILHEDSLFGTTVSEHVKSFAQETGFNIVDVIGYSAATGDLTTEANRIIARDPDVVVHVGYYRDGVLYLRTAEELGIDIPVIACASGAMSHPKMPEDVGEYAEGILDANYRENPINPESQAMHERYLRDFGRPMSTHAIYSYAAARVLLDAIERAGSSDPQDIQVALRETDFYFPLLPYQDGRVRFDEKGECSTARSPLMQVQNGEIKVVLPEEVADAELIWPVR